jgi:hypothetical protein
VLTIDMAEHLLDPKEGLKRAISNYLNVSRHKNNRQYYREYNYWPAEELAWKKLEEAIERAKEAGIQIPLDNEVLV